MFKVKKNSARGALKWLQRAIKNARKSGDGNILVLDSGDGNVHLDFYLPHRCGTTTSGRITRAVRKKVNSSDWMSWSEIDLGLALAVKDGEIESKKYDGWKISVIPA